MTEPAEPALFEPDWPAGGPAVTAMVEQLGVWRAAGQQIGPVVARTLLDQAYAVDLARLARRHTAITGANRVILELVNGFGLNAPARSAEVDPFDAFLERVAADDADRRAADLAGEPAAPVGESPPA